MGLFGVEIKDVGAAVGSVGTLAKDLRAAITGKAVIDSAAQAELELRAATLEAEVIKAQLAINQAEAGNKSLFVSGWRPALGWIGVLAFGTQFFIRPVLGAFGIAVPNLDINEIWPMMAGILGLGTLRSFEKKSGVASK